MTTDRYADLRKALDELDAADRALARATARRAKALAALDALTPAGNGTPEAPPADPTRIAIAPSATGPGRSAGGAPAPRADGRDPEPVPGAPAAHPTPVALADAQEYGHVWRGPAAGPTPAGPADAPAGGDTEGPGRPGGADFAGLTDTQLIDAFRRSGDGRPAGCRSEMERRGLPTAGLPPLPLRVCSACGVRSDRQPDFALPDRCAGCAAPAGGDCVPMTAGEMAAAYDRMAAAAKPRRQRRTKGAPPAPAPAPPAEGEQSVGPAAPGLLFDEQTPTAAGEGR